MGFRGFSLIELMVVVAIVAVLASVAVPSYIDYIAKTRVTTLWPILDGVKNRSMEFYARTGLWPNATELGYTATDDLSLDTPTALNQYMTDFTITPTTSGTCTANVIVITWSLDYAAVGIDNATMYDGTLYLGEMPGGYIASMCRESLDGIAFGHTYIGDVCTYSDLSSFNTAICM